MNSAKISSEGLFEFKFSKQAILERSYTLWGSEIQVHPDNFPDGVPDDFNQQLKCAYGEALRRTKSSVLPLQMSSKPVGHKLVRLEQFALMDEDTLEEVIRTCDTLATHKQQLIISIENTLSTLPGPAERRAMIRQLYSLKDRSTIKLAYNNYTIDTRQANLLVDLELYDYIKMPFPDSVLRLSLNTRSGLFDRLYDDMLALMSSTKVSFIADNVEYADSATLAKRLPFDYFQGSYFSPADNL